jgi:cysteine-rich repeat protein
LHADVAALASVFVYSGVLLMNLVVRSMDGTMATQSIFRIFVASLLACAVFAVAPSVGFANDAQDSDGDGIPDEQEDTNGDGNLRNDDTDGDGIPDYLDVCGDGRAATAIDEACDDGNAVNGDGCTNECQIEDGWRCEKVGPCTDIDECKSGEDVCGDNATCKNTEGSFECPCNFGFEMSADGACEPGADSDDDGLTDLEECTDPDNCEDSDGDRIPDYLDEDSDNDGISDADEHEAGTDPTDPDDPGEADAGGGDVGEADAGDVDAGDSDAGGFVDAGDGPDAAIGGDIGDEFEQDDPLVVRGGGCSSAPESPPFAALVWVLGGLSTLGLVRVRRRHVSEG